MYVPWNGDISLTEAEYEELAPLADAIIDDWTLGRVGRAVKNDEELPDTVKTLYKAIIQSLPNLMANSEVSKGSKVSSFSNGVDSFSFDTESGASEQLKSSLGWILETLPVEWISACVSFEGGNRYAG